MTLGLSVGRKGGSFELSVYVLKSAVAGKGKCRDIEIFYQKGLKGAEYYGNTCYLLERNRQYGSNG